MKKKITIIGLNYYPEDTAIGLYTTQLTQYLDQHGFDVEVITGFPYYPAWKIASNYKDKPSYFQEKLDNISIYRHKQYVPENPTFLKRILLLLHFTYGAWRNSYNIKETDLVLAIVPFTTAVFVGNILAKRKKAKLWVHIQDFEFDAAAETNLVGKKKFLFNILFYIERKLLNKVDSISTISNAMLMKLKTKIKEDKSTVLLPNWVDVDNINPSKANIHPYLTSNKFKILYSGNIGEKQDWEFFLKVVKSINDDEIEFIVIGSGSKKEWIVNQIKILNNVLYYPPVPYEELADLLCSADLHILFQKENVIDTVMPSKILGMMASAKPSIITGNLQSEVATVLTKSKGGEYIKANNKNQVINAIFDIKKSPDQMGINARNYVSEYFSSEKILSLFLNQFKNITT